MKELTAYFRNIQIVMTQDSYNQVIKMLSVDNYSIYDIEHNTLVAPSGKDPELFDIAHYLNNGLSLYYQSDDMFPLCYLNLDPPKCNKCVFSAFYYNGYTNQTGCHTVIRQVLIDAGFEEETLNYIDMTNGHIYFNYEYRVVCFKQLKAIQNWFLTNFGE